MMTDDEYDALRAELALLRKQRVHSAYGLIPASVEHLEQLLAKVASDDERAEVYALLVSECSRARNDRLYIDCLRRRVRDFASDPMSYAGLAFRLAMIEPEHRGEALATADKALELAKAQDRQVRYCATNLARIALMLDDYETLNRALVELVADAGAERAEDTGYEFDFVDQIDVQRFDAVLLARYKELSK
jgi:hypothetical protein